MQKIRQTLQTLRWLLWKEILHEWRTKEVIVAMTLFSVGSFTLFHFALNRNQVDGALATGVLWATLLFAAILGVNRLFSAEHQNDALTGLLTTPINRTLIFVAKSITLGAYLLISQAVTVLVFAVLLLPEELFGKLPQIIPVLILANIGISMIGTLVAALATQSRTRELLVPLLSIPLFIPITIAGAKVTEPIFTLDASKTNDQQWLWTLGVYDVIFALIAIAVFDYLFDE